MPSPDLAGLAALRVLVGASCACACVLFWLRPALLDGFLTGPARFSYPGFAWVRPPPPGLTFVLPLVGLLLSACVTLGLWFRVAAPLLALGASYVFLLDATFYLSTFYGLCLVLVLLACSPAHHLASLDARRSPDGCDGRGAALALGLLRFQVIAVYAFAGLAKWDDDWLAGRVLAAMLAPERKGFIAATLPLEPALVTMAWIGMLIDLFAPAAILWRRTRVLALLAIVVFHVHNALSFRLGGIPWLMLVLTTVLLPAGWPRRLVRLPPSPPTTAAARPWRVVAAIWVALQIAIPLRHHLFPGRPYFHFCGVQFSWALRTFARVASTTFLVRDRATGETRELPFGPALHPKQRARAMGRPDLIWQEAQRIAAEARAAGRDVEVRARATVALSGRPPSPLVDPTVDLARAPRHMLGMPPWVRPSPDRERAP